MATRYDNVIVFGPTGDVGGAAALEAGKRGAKVCLAMRDPTKKIAGLSNEQEQSGKFTRVQADLSQPESVKAAVQASGAKAAFVYLLVTGSLKPALEAMKEAGVEYVVFLSTSAIEKGMDLRTIPPEAVIPFIHAQSEIAIEDAGLAYTTLRAGSFATNAYKMTMDATKTPPEIYACVPSVRVIDNIVPLDMGRVAGAVLVDRPSSGSKEVVYLFGPKLMGELEMCNTVKEFSEEEVKVVQQTPEDWAARLRAIGVPDMVVAFLVEVQQNPDLNLFVKENAEEGSKNVTRFSGYEPTTFEEFVKTRNKE